jgi:hypothetical protein
MHLSCLYCARFDCATAATPLQSILSWMVNEVGRKCLPGVKRIATAQLG